MYVRTLMWMFLYCRMPCSRSSLVLLGALEAELGGLRGGMARLGQHRQQHTHTHTPGSRSSQNRAEASLLYIILQQVRLHTKLMRQSGCCAHLQPCHHPDIHTTCVPSETQVYLMYIWHRQLTASQLTGMPQ